LRKIKNRKYAKFREKDGICVKELLNVSFIKIGAAVRLKYNLSCWTILGNMFGEFLAPYTLRTYFERE
jgi:hypothetical protein